MYKAIVPFLAAFGLLLLGTGCSEKFPDESLRGVVPDRAQILARQPPEVTPPANPVGDDQPPVPAKRLTPTPVGR